VTRDLPALGQPSPGRPPATAGLAPRARDPLVRRDHGRLQAARPVPPASVVNVLAIMGGDEIDLRDAEIDANGLTMNMYAVMGGSTIYVPNTVEVEISGFLVHGRQRGSWRGAPAPSRRSVIHIRSFNLMGGNTIWRLPPRRGACP